MTVSNMTTATGSIDNYWLQCNKGTKVRVFDTYDWEFKSEFDPDNKGSKVPSAIVKLVGGNEAGGATLKKPKAGWDNPALDPIFSIRNELPLPDLSPTPGLNTTLATATGEPQPANKGAIIGGAVGGICVVAVAVGVSIFFWKVHRKPSQEGPSGSELQGADSRAELYGNYSQGLYNAPHELYAYEPHEMDVAVVGHYAPGKIGGLKETAAVGLPPS